MNHVIQYDSPFTELLRKGLVIHVIEHLAFLLIHLRPAVGAKFYLRTFIGVVEVIRQSSLTR